MKYPTQSELQELSASDRLQLLEDVWETFVRAPDSLPLSDEHRFVRAPDSLPLSDEHRRVIERRLDAFNRDPSAGASWEEVRRRIKKQR
jgi:putative addiction module component (TIGR02574 family)